MSNDDLTVMILREIRDEVRLNRTELKAELGTLREELSAELGALSARVDVTNERLGSVETTLQDLAAQQLMMTRYVKNVVDRHELSIDDLRERMVRVETKLGT